MMWRRGCGGRAWRQLRNGCRFALWRHLPRQLLIGSAKEARTCSSFPYMEISPEVADAVAARRPVVALETTLVTHGMPYPDNINTAVEVEGLVRSHGALPATIGILEGKIHVGLSTPQLAQLAELSQSVGVMKVSRRDLAYALSQGVSGGTTVAATMLCAHRAGVHVFVTGGLGGVHREGEKTLDVSADVVELGRTPVAVVCSGVKSILDIRRTLEVLETQGVAVATYGELTDFPSFFTRSSGFKAPFNVQSATEAAEMINVNLQLRVGSGVVIAVPIPEEFSAEGSGIETSIQRALREARSAGIGGKEVTPYVLQRVNELTSGRSLQANISLIRHNASVGSRIAIELANLQSEPLSSVGEHESDEVSKMKGSSQPYGEPQKTPVVVGASVLDFIAKTSSPEVKNEGTNPGTLHQAFGGVGRNIAECLSRLGTAPFLISAVGEDTSGRGLTHALQDHGMCLSGLYRSTSLPTASYCVVLNGHGEMACGIGDMDINQCITPEWVERFVSKLKAASVVCVDGNVPVETIQYICDKCCEYRVPVWFEPTCIDKARKPVLRGFLDKIHYTSPNLSELRSMHKALCGTTSSTEPSTDLTVQQKLAECCALVPALLEKVPHVLVTLGKDGVLWGSRDQGNQEKMLHFSTLGRPVHAPTVNVSGAGDSFVGAMISSLSHGLSYEVAIKAGMRAANLSVSSTQAVSPDVKPELFSEQQVLEWGPWEPTLV